MEIKIKYCDCFRDQIVIELFSFYFTFLYFFFLLLILILENIRLIFGNMWTRCNGEKVRCMKYSRCTYYPIKKWKVVVFFILIFFILIFSLVFLKYSFVFIFKLVHSFKISDKNIFVFFVSCHFFSFFKCQTFL